MRTGPPRSGVEPLAVELVAEDHRRQVVGVFEHAADRQRTAEHLLRVVVVVAVVEDAAKVLLRLRQPDAPRAAARPPRCPCRAGSRCSGRSSPWRTGPRASRRASAGAAKSSAVPSFFVSCLPSVAGCSGSEMTSSFHVSRVRPTSRSLLLGQRVRHRLAARHVAGTRSGGVKYGSSFSTAGPSSGGGPRAGGAGGPPGGGPGGPGPEEEPAGQLGVPGQEVVGHRSSPGPAPGSGSPGPASRS